MRTRVNLRIKIRSVTVFFMVSLTQTLKGICSKLQNGKHIILLDFDSGHTLEEVRDFLRGLQQEHRLSNWYVFSDKEGSYRAWCFNQVSFAEYLLILAEAMYPIQYLDYNFFYWTVFKGTATLRISSKTGRPEQKIVAVLESYELPIPFELLREALYDTGVDKGITVKIPLKTEV